MRACGLNTNSLAEPTRICSTRCSATMRAVKLCPAPDSSMVSSSFAPNVRAASWSIETTGWVSPGAHHLPCITVTEPGFSSAHITERLPRKRRDMPVSRSSSSGTPFTFSMRTATLGTNSGCATTPFCFAISVFSGPTCSGVMPIRNTLGASGGALCTISPTSECCTRYTVSVNITPSPSATRMACA